MGRIEARLEELGIVLPPEVIVPQGVVLPFAFVNVVEGRAIISGHGPQAPDGQITGPFGQVGATVSVDEAVEAARLTGLSILGSLQRTLGTLDRITGWVKVLGMVNSAPGFNQQPAVINGFSNLIVEVFGPEVGRHARSAVGMAALPWDLPVEIEAEVAIH